ncbi:MAG: MBL fold metallo-hydrolase [Vicinamibacterales bacterium]
MKTASRRRAGPASTSGHRGLTRRTSRLAACASILVALLSPAPARGQASPPAPGDVRVTLLGTGNPRPVMNRFGPSILVEVGETRLLFDVGRGAIQRLFQIGAAPFFRPMTRVFLTHLHSDHVVGLPDVWLTGWLFGRTAPLVVTGPAGTQAMVEGLRQAYAFDIKTRSIDESLPISGGEIAGRDVAPGVVYDEQGIKVTAFYVDHGPVKPALGYRIDAAGRSIVLSGDTRETPALNEQARGVDLLVCEVVSPDVERRRNQLADEHAMERVLAHHIPPEAAGRLFADAKPRLAVYSHIVPSPTTADDLLPPTRTTYTGPLEVGYDLMMITVGDRITVAPRTVVADP